MEKLQSLLHVFHRVERFFILCFVEFLLLFKPFVFALLDECTIRKHVITEVASGVRTINRSLETLLHKDREIPTMVDMRMR